MRNSIKRTACFFLGAFVIILGSCSQNPIDKKLDEMEALYVRMNNIAHERNPSDREIINLKKHMLSFQSSWQMSLVDNPELQESKFTLRQKKRAADIMMKLEGLNDDPEFQRIMKRLRFTDSNY